MHFSGLFCLSLSVQINLPQDKSLSADISRDSEMKICNRTSKPIFYHLCLGKLNSNSVMCSAYRYRAF